MKKEVFFCNLLWKNAGAGSFFVYCQANFALPAVDQMLSLLKYFLSKNAGKRIRKPFYKLY